MWEEYWTGPETPHEQTRRATVELSATSGGAKVLGRCLAVVQLD
jgi:hypothetical protein